MRLNDWKIICKQIFALHKRKLCVLRRIGKYIRWKLFVKLIQFYEINSCMNKQNLHIYQLTLTDAECSCRAMISIIAPMGAAIITFIQWFLQSPSGYKSLRRALVFGKYTPLALQQHKSTLSFQHCKFLCTLSSWDCYVIIILI